MFELPLFPLNTVLFPGMPVALHIFEERYKKMVRYCQTNRQPFGVVLIRRGVEALGPSADTFSVGCTAQIIKTQRLKEGHMNIAAIGKKRFRIISLQHHKPYLVGQVEIVPLAESNPKVLARSGRNLRPWIDRYLDILSQVGDIELDASRFPHDPVALAYLGAILLQMPPKEKQLLLEIETAASLLSHVHKVYRREVALLSAILRCSQEQDGPFSTN